MRVVARRSLGIPVFISTGPSDGRYLTAPVLTRPERFRLHCHRQALRFVVQFSGDGIF